MGGAQEVDEHLQRHRIDRAVVNDAEGADIRAMAVFVMVMVAVVMVLMVTVRMVMMIVVAAVMVVVTCHGLVLERAIDIGTLSPPDSTQPAMEKSRPFPLQASRRRSSARAD